MQPSSGRMASFARRAAGGERVKVVAVINHKGGVGKTTLTANLGAGFAARGQRVLRIDLDGQASLTLSFFPPREWTAELLPEQTLRHWLHRIGSARGERPAQPRS